MVYVCDMVNSATRLCKKLYFGLSHSSSGPVFIYLFFLCACFSIFPVLGQIWFCLLPLYHNFILSSHLNHATPQGPSLSDTKIICCMFQVSVMTAQGRSHICVSVYVCVFLREHAMLLDSSRLGFLILAPNRPVIQDMV